MCFNQHSFSFKLHSDAIWSKVPQSQYSCTSHVSHLHSRRCSWNQTRQDDDMNNLR
jgi:hypothetical protein